MPEIEDVLERLVTDPAFRALLRTDPGSALTGYTLTAEDLSLLAKRVNMTDGATGPVVQRTAIERVSSVCTPRSTTGLE